MYAMEVNLSLRRIKATARIGEVNAAIRVTHYIIGPMQPLALPPVSNGCDGAVGFPASYSPIVSLAHYQPSLKVKGQSVGRAAVFTNNLWLAAGHQAVDKVAAVIDEQQVAFRMPQRPFGKLEASS
jgi:hypothetical protein